MKAYILCRNSTEEQEKKGTIQSQVEYAKKYLELHGPEMGITEHEFYIDEGISGTIALKDRPEGARLLRDIKKTKSGILLVYRLDRLARSVKHVLDTYDFLVENDVGLRSMTESFDTTTPTGKFFMTLLASIAALERDTIYERTQLGKQRNIQQGKWANGNTPFGYSKNEAGYLEINESEAEIIRNIFKMYLDGMTSLELARYLNGANVPVGSTGRSKVSENAKWASGTVSKLLRSSVYTGTYIANKKSVKGAQTVSIPVPVIIDQDTFDEVQKMKEENLKIARGKKGRFYILRGLLKCHECGSTFGGTAGGTPKSPLFYYRCWGLNDSGSGLKCSSVGRIRAEQLEDAVWEATKEVIKNPEAYRQRIEEQLKQVVQSAPSIDDELKDIEEAINQKTESRNKVISLMVRNLISDQEGESQLTELAEAIKALVGRREMLFSSKEVAISYENEIMNIELALNRWKDIVDRVSEPEQKAEILNLFIRKIVVIKEDNQITTDIQFRGLALPILADGESHTARYLDISEVRRISKKQPI